MSIFRSTGRYQQAVATTFAVTPTRLGASRLWLWDSRGRTVAINGSRPTGNHHPRCRRESICIAWFRASHPDGVAVHSTPGNPTGATGPHAIAARLLLGVTRPIDEGDDGFTSGCPANTPRFRRLDAALAPRCPSGQARHPAHRRKTQPSHHLYLNREQS